MIIFRSVEEKQAEKSRRAEQFRNGVARFAWFPTRLRSESWLWLATFREYHYADGRVERYTETQLQDLDRATFWHEERQRHERMLKEQGRA